MNVSRRMLFLIVAVGPLSVPPAAQAFGTINSLGQSAEHEKITRLALGPVGFQPDTLDEIAGKSGTFGAVGAPDNPLRGLMSQHSAHCDGGDYLGVAGYPHPAQDARATLTDCQAWIFSHVNAAVSAADELLENDGSVDDSQIPTFFSCVYDGSSGRAKCNVLEALGLAFHAGQDFYSHSNWTDAMPQGTVLITNPPGLANDGRAAWLDPRQSAAFPQGLITGCYDGFPESAFCDDRVKHERLNKDKGPIEVASGSMGQGSTPRAEGNDNFARAVAGAVADTRDKWVYFTEQVRKVYGEESGRTIICAILEDDPASTCP